MDWFILALQNIASRDTALVVVQLVLILVIDRRLLAMVQSNERLNGIITREVTHNSARMEEIRRYVLDIARGTKSPE